MKSYTFFQFLTLAIVVLFMGVMGIVVIIAYSRPSRSMRLSMVRVQEMRVEASKR
ncbi:MAG: hypothetical protein WB791_01520 [Waddliaceae bacterium]